MKKKGKLTVIAGPMFAGKTTKLLAIYKVLTKLDHSVLCMKAEVDGNGGIGHTNSHDERSLPVIFINPKRSSEVLRYFKKDGGVKKVVIDAVHFFPSTRFKKVVKKLLDWNVDVYLNGLLYDYRRKQYGATFDLYAMADEKIKLFSICEKCGSKAPHTERIAGGLKQSLSSKKSKYIPSCSRCHVVYKG